MFITNNQPIILYKYLTKDILKYFLFALFTLVILIFFIDFIELFRRSSNKAAVRHLVKAEIFDIIIMALLKISENIQKILPFAALIGSIACFNQWRKKKYYIVQGNGGHYEEPRTELYFGNSGTGVRLLTGLLSSSNLNATLSSYK